eukprot:4085360-Prymnesium_polylepis.2
MHGKARAPCKGPAMPTSTGAVARAASIHNRACDHTMSASSGATTHRCRSNTHDVPFDVARRPRSDDSTRTRSPLGLRRTGREPVSYTHLRAHETLMNL